MESFCSFIVSFCAKHLFCNDICFSFVTNKANNYQTQKRKTMKVLHTTDLRNWKQRHHHAPIMGILNKANIQWQESPPGKVRSISVSEADYPEAKRLLDAYFNKSAKKVAAHNAKPKLVWCKRKVDVAILYKVLKRKWDDFYLPEQWKGGHSIQNYDQTTFYTFDFIKFEKCTHPKLKQGEQYIHIRRHHDGQCWVMNVMDVLKPGLEIYEMAGNRAKLPWVKYINDRCLKTFTKKDFEQWKKDGKIAEKTQF